MQQTRHLLRSALLASRIHQVNTDFIISRHITNSPVSFKYIFDAREENVDQKEKQLTLKKGRVFDQIAQDERNRVTFERAVHKYTTRHDKYGRGDVEFIYAAIARMKEFNAHRDLTLYKKILKILPKNKMVSRTAWQIEMMHFPKQQQCTIDLMDQMELNGVVPDDEFGHLLKDLFGTKTHAFRKYQRMMYWMPKFKHANPYPVPYDLPDDPINLARLALNRMAVDKQNQILEIKTDQLDGEDVLDKTFVVSAQSPDQQHLLANHLPEKPIFVEGGFNVWLRQKSLTYFILKSDTTESFKTYMDDKMNGQDEDKYFSDFLKDVPFFSSEKPTSVMKQPTVHEQMDGTVLAMCITGTGSKNSLASWIKWLQETNPKLSQIPVVFRLSTPETGLVVIKGEEERMQELATVT